MGAAVPIIAVAASVYGQHQANKQAKKASRRQQRQAERQYQETLAREQAEKQRRTDNVAAIRSAYGIGGDASAAGNRASIDEAIRQYYRETLQKNLTQANEGYAGASRVSRQNLARAGQLGSSLDSGAQAGNLSDYLRARQNALAQAQRARAGLQSSLDSQRLGLESQASSGTLANPDIGSIGANRDALLAHAQSSITPAAIGDLFRTAGETYYQGRVAGAEGAQGLRAFNLGAGGSSKRGSIT